MTTVATNASAETKDAAKPTANGLATLDSGSSTIAAFSSDSAFSSAQRMAKALASSALVPKDYQGNVANCLIAMELASRIGASVLMVMQHLVIVHGKPTWSATFLIATVNSSGKFTPLRFRWEGKPGTDDWGCRAVAKDRASGEECVGTLVTLGMAKAEGWATRNGSKYKALGEQMLAYRAASFWTRLYSPELSLGMQTADEVIDAFGEDTTPVESPRVSKVGNPKDLEAALQGVTSDGEILESEIIAPPEAAKATREPGEDDQ